MDAPNYVSFATQGVPIAAMDAQIYVYFATQGVPIAAMDALEESELSMHNRTKAQRHEKMLWRNFSSDLVFNLGLVRVCSFVQAGLLQIIVRSCIWCYAFIAVTCCSTLA
jgi:orotate phosphoribosyltransferase-like protein